MLPVEIDLVAKMYQKLCEEVYPHRTFNGIEAFRHNVEVWTQFNYDIMIIEDKYPIAFMLCYHDNMGGIVDTFYKLECAYIVPHYRNSRAILLMKNLALSYADKEGIILQCNASMITQSSKIISKFGVPLFTTYERMPNV